MVREIIKEKMRRKRKRNVYVNCDTQKFCLGVERYLRKKMPFI